MDDNALHDSPHYHRNKPHQSDAETHLNSGEGCAQCWVRNLGAFCTGRISTGLLAPGLLPRSCFGCVDFGSVKQRHLQYNWEEHSVRHDCQKLSNSIIANRIKFFKCLGIFGCKETSTQSHPPQILANIFLWCLEKRKDAANI